MDKRIGRLLTGKIRSKAATLTMMALAAPALVGLAAPAQAGEWKIVGEVVTGTITLEEEGQDTFTGPLNNVNGNEAPAVSWSFSTGSSESLPTSEIHIADKIDGSVCVVLQWYRNKIWEFDENGIEEEVDDPDDNPPAVVWLRVRAGASSSAVSDITRENRMADKETATASVTDGKTVTDDDVKSASATTKLMLIPWPTGGAERVNGPVCSLKATGSLGGRRRVSADTSEGENTGWLFLEGTVSAGADYSAAIDNRGVRLTRPGAIGETYNASTNTTTGDSTFSYEESYARFEPSNQWPNWQTFVPSFIGQWSEKIAYSGGLKKDVDFTWSPAGGTLLDPDRWDYSSQLMPIGSLWLNSRTSTSFWEGTPSSPTTRTVTY